MDSVLVLIAAPNSGAITDDVIASAALQPGTMALVPLGVIMRTTRSAVAEVLNQDFVLPF
mgnify:CR=1 FL=1